jgi:hypothetical protein
MLEHQSRNSAAAEQNDTHRHLLGEAAILP